MEKEKTEWFVLTDGYSIQQGAHDWKLKKTNPTKKGTSVKVFNYPTLYILLKRYKEKVALETPMLEIFDKLTQIETLLLGIKTAKNVFKI